MSSEEVKNRTVWKISNALDLLCKQNVLCNERLRSFLSKQIWSELDRQSILTTLSELFISPKCVMDICSYFRPLVLDIAERTKNSILRQGHSNSRLCHKFAVALGLALRICPELKRFTSEFVRKSQPFLDCENEEPKRKKTKREKISDLDWCCAMYHYVTHLQNVSEQISIKIVVKHLSNKDSLVRWYAASIIGKLTGMSEQQLEKFVRKYVTEDEERQTILRCYHDDNLKQTAAAFGLGAVNVESSGTALTHTRHDLLTSDLVSSVVSISGVLLPRLVSEEASHFCLAPWIGVPSMLDSLRSLSLAVSAGQPVLVQGPVGCGKTSLVQHLAALTGRCTAPHLLKVQLGDQTDSKALLGTYQCTELPGQFVWRPGILMEAVVHGHWLLLEDLDHAPMEVLSTLASLLQTSTLSVPGHGDLIQAAPGFQLFATQRLFVSGDGLHTQNRNSAMLDKLWTCVNIQPLSSSELQQILTDQFPSLTNVIGRLLDIYFMLSAGRHHFDQSSTSSETSEETIGKFQSLTGRLISVRDLISWCSRISMDFDHTSPDSPARIFQAALDCFVACLSNPSKRLPLAEAIAAKLGITKDKAEYFLMKHKPTIDISPMTFSVGRAALLKKPQDVLKLSRGPSATFSFTRPSVALLEKVAVCVARNEPVLLVGETGTGKTSSVQYLAQELGYKLHVINLNQQSDSIDLLGGFKPVDLKFVILPFREEFETLFCETFSRKQNARFLGHLQNCFLQKRWNDVLALMDHCQQAAAKKFPVDTENGQRWQKTGIRLQKLKQQIRDTENVLAFSFIEGTMVKALRQGEWVLLDEINLAAAETLECLAGLLESTDGSVVLTERGDMNPVVRHKDFRLFACMNPATDFGKKDLTPGIRNRFTEFYVDELESSVDLKVLVGDYLRGLSLTSAQLEGIVKFYLEIRAKASCSLVDGTGHKPHYSLRTLCRALRFARIHSCGSTARTLFEGFSLSFLTQLDRTSHPLVEQMICQHILSKVNIKSILKQPLPEPGGKKHLNFEGYWISCGTQEPSVPEHYILTPSVRANLKDLARVVSAGNHPVLLQGETSVGKTSLITWLACSSGNRCVRVNNHEHTDLQEYVGCYVADESGKLVFREGVLVEAMRKGHWIILDELNLAPTDVLEALNRLLDDNQELFIPETQEMVKAHPKFMLFATQNPPGHYGGRKMLSRAFRNRFVELHFDEIPKDELECILHQRCNIPLSYAHRLVAIMADLQLRRQSSGLFAGKQGFMTLRDLFRWAERYKCQEVNTASKFYDWDQHLADHGYMLLAGRVRRPEEAAVIQEVIERHMKCSVSPERLFDLTPNTSSTVLSVLQAVMGQTDLADSTHFSSSILEGFEHVVWTRSMRRLAVLIGQAVRYGEPVVLVGDTGCGKTTVCQLYAKLKEKNLFSVNCHLHTESADFLGGLRPVRSHEHNADIKQQKLFEWVDGPLVTAMKTGSMFLIDEISLADDSVLERLNSVLEPERSILLAEKGGGEGSENEVEIVQAMEGFQVFATMNPGGDFGKKELSPALRNRFTEIWCPQSCDRDDLVSIIEHNMRPGIQLSNNPDDESSGFGSAIMDFVVWFSNNEIGKRCTVSIRDILSWVNFINICVKGHDEDRSSNFSSLDPAVAYIHGACLVFLDSLGTSSTSRLSDVNAEHARLTCLTYALQQMKAVSGCDLSLEQLGLWLNSSHPKMILQPVVLTQKCLTIFPFSITRELQNKEIEEKYTLQAPTTCINAQRILRGLQMSRPLLLEGAPGVGKTSLVAAVARLAGRELVRINLSEQTDVTDLFGADLPVEGGAGGAFAWRDGPFLQALKAGHWVVFDEMNLASQSVLEGLNACLDHRGEVYIPELGRTFHIQHGQTRIFACQNPLNQGGGRKGLPRSFLNRFTQVYMEPLAREDLIFICTAMYPNIQEETLIQMIDFNMKMQEETMITCAWGQKGAPWEYNLRDLNRWCDLLLANQTSGRLCPGEYVGLLYQDRMRTAEDKRKVGEVYDKVFGSDGHMYQPSHILHVTPSFVQCGHTFLPRNCRQSRSEAAEWRDDGGVLVLHHSLGPLESLMTCISMGWMAILVGPSSSGKSSVVHLLAELTGHTLLVLPMSSAMDTTELLGGFEQTDIGRHVTETTTDVEEEIRAFQRCCFMNGEMEEVGVALTLDEELINLKSEMKREILSDSGEENTTLLIRVRKLQRLVLKLKQLQPHLVHLTELSSRLEHHLLALEMAQSGAGGFGGGTFEWLDSLLVKALQTGAWLLIDNVNFCSPSVLDRLNALLEPGGKLSVNERGVIDGKVPTITPHPQFRLFLSMDPRYGEISRAMRNRGIEIYILGEEDGSPYSQFDTLSMLQATGLCNKEACDWLLQLHRILQEQLMGNEQPCIGDLLKTGSLVQMQFKRGINMLAALTQATESVYVRSVQNAATRKCVRALLSEHLVKLSETNVTAKGVAHKQLSWKLLAPSVKQYQQQSIFASVQQMSRVLSFLLGQPESIGHDKCADENSYIHALYTALYIFLSLQSSKSWKLSLDWFKQSLVDTEALADKIAMTLELKDSKRIMLELQTLKQLADKNLGLVFDGQLWKDYQQALILLCGECTEVYEMLSEQPWDLDTNPQALDKALFLILKRQPPTHSDDQGQVSAQLEEFTAIKNRLQLMQMSVTIVEAMKHGVNVLKEVTDNVFRQKSKCQMSLIHLSSLLCHLITYLPEIVRCAPGPSIALLHKMQDRLLWLPRLLEETLFAGTVSGQQEEVILSHLTVHWNWCQRKLLSHLVSSESDPSLTTMIRQLQTMLGTFDDAGKRFGKFWSSWGHPVAFASEIEARSWQEWKNLCSLLSIHSPLPLESLKQRVKVLTSHRKALQQSLISVLRKLLCKDFNLTVDFKLLENILASHGDLNASPLKTISRSSSHTAFISSTLNFPTTHERQSSDIVQLWPVYEHLGLLTELSHVLEFSSNGENIDKRRTLANFMLHYTPAIHGCALWGENPFNTGQTAEWLMQVLHCIWHSPATMDCQRWLTWGSSGEEDDCSAVKQDTTGPAVFHRSVLLFYTSHILSSPVTTHHKRGQESTQFEFSQMHVTLGGLSAQLAQIRALANHLWKHADVLGSQSCSMRSLEQILLVKMFLSMLKALISILDASVHKEWTLIIQSLEEMRTEACTPCQNHGSLLEAWKSNSSTTKELLLRAQHIVDVHLGRKSKRRPDDNSPVSDLIRCCFDVVGETLDCADEESVLMIGQGLLYVGLSLAHLLSPSGPMDPVQKAALRLKHFRQELNDTLTELFVWETHLQLSTGKGIENTCPKLYHPRLNFLLKRRVQLLTMVASLEQRQSYREGSFQFLRLSQEVTVFLQTIGSPATTNSLVTRLLKACKSDSSTAYCMTALQEEQTLQSSLRQFLERLKQDFHYLQDIVVPVGLAVEVMRLGIRTVAQAAMLRIKQLQIGRCPANGSLGEVIKDLGAFPSICENTPTLLVLARKLCSQVTLEIVSCLSGLDASKESLTFEHQIQSPARLLYCSLLLLKAHAKQTQELNSDLFADLVHILDLFVRAWRDQEEHRRQREEEEGSLYRIKEKMHGDDRTEKEREEADFREAFPSFHADYQDMIEAARLEDTGTREQPMDKGDGVQSSEEISEHEMDEICCCHIYLMHHLTSAGWLSKQHIPKGLENMDILRPTLLAYQVALDLGKTLWELLNEAVDHQVIGSHILMCGYIAQSVHLGLEVTSQLYSQSPEPSKCYNIYVDPNILEVIQCQPILQQVMIRVAELQKEWPDHPTLKQLCQIVERICSFPVTSPVIKFLTGMELLLQTAQYWETNASSKVSMATQLAEVTSLIVRWRKLELRCWSGALDIEVERSRKQASRWWFHLYNLVMSFISQSQGTDVAELLKSLKQFMENSTMGEYSARLDILLAFHCHLVNMEASPNRDYLMCVLWNVYHFYKQFLPNVNAQILLQRGPIEKELKGFVKIARWSDLNYWALKESTEKTHRTVHKNTRAFQAILKQPVKGLIGDKPSDVGLSSDTDGGNESFSGRLSSYHQFVLNDAQKIFIEQLVVSGEEDGLSLHLGCNLLSKLTCLSKRAAKHWHSILRSSDTCQAIIHLDEFTGLIIQESHELQNMVVSQTADKKKQTSEAKHINLHKRKALADLFKQLASLGLSYKKGLSKKTENHIDSALKLPPLDIYAHLNKNEPLVGLWEGCEIYFRRCLSRLAQFSVSLHSPAKELGPANIERCQGFVEHLTGIYLAHRKQLTNLFQHFMLLKQHVTVLESLKTNENFLPPQSRTKYWLMEAKHQLTQVVQGLTQFSLLLQACPAPGDFSATSNPSPFTPEDLPQMAYLQLGNNLWSKCFDNIKTIIDQAQIKQNRLATISDKILFTREDAELISATMDELASIGQGLQEVINSLYVTPSGKTRSSTSSISFLIVSIRKVYLNFTLWKNHLAEDHFCCPLLMKDSDGEKTAGVHMASCSLSQASTDIVSVFAECLERLVESTLLNIQRLVKGQNDARKKTKESEEDENDSEDKSLKDKHLLILADDLRQQATDFQSQEVVNSLQEIITHLGRVTDSSDISSVFPEQPASVCSRLLLRCHPLLKIYLHMLETHVAESVSLHRTLGKMLSVLLAVFTELAVKGFCLPAEYSDEVGGEGASEFVDIEGGGLGEGEGAKDVSEQIESEDQLDEACRPEDKKEDRLDEQPDVAPEVNAIEMTDDFDGKPQDLEQVEGEEEEEEKDNGSDDLEKQMGEVEGKGMDKLDEQMWGSDEETETNDQEEKEEDGPGSGQRGESELVAKDDLKNSSKAEEEEQKEEANTGENNEPKPHNLDEFDESEYDDNKVDPHHGDQGQQEEAENLDLPDDLNLDRDEKGEETAREAEEPPTSQLDDGTEDEIAESNKPEGDLDEGNEETEKEEDRNDIPDEDRNKDENAVGQDGSEDADMEPEELDKKENEEKSSDLKDSNEKEEPMEEEGEGNKGFAPQQDDGHNTEPQENEEQMEENLQGVNDRVKTSHVAPCAVQSETAQDETTGQNDQKEQKGVGTAIPEEEEGHTGSTSSTVTESGASQDQKQMQRRPGHSNSDRSLGSAEERFRRLKTTAQSSQQVQEELKEEQKAADFYEHIADDSSHADAQTLDAATDEQQQQQQIIARPEEEADRNLDNEDVQMADEESENNQKLEERSAINSAKPQLRETSHVEVENKEEMLGESQKTGLDGDRVLTLGAERPPESTIHTQLEHLHLDAFSGELDLDALRSQLEDSMKTWAHPDVTDHQATQVAAEAWQKYEMLTSSLSQELCEQLRLVLEPSQATKLKGDYRTGKRLNMRKVIPYIASQFRKDKIWLRRTKPSKRQYQIMLAIDDSSSMANNHSKQLAFESLALMANALTLLETGELAVCSFGESVKLLHSFTESFSNQAGARVLQQFTFEQKKTRIAQMLQQATTVMLEARGRQHSLQGRPETAQLLLIVSDGRGVFAEGPAIVRNAVRQAREVNIFLVFIVLDEPKNKDSILDIKVPVFKPDKSLPEIRSYMEDFPFPFYVILRDINSLPQILSDALRQWFELVTAAET